MPDPSEVTQKSPRVPWNRGKLIGAKPPLRSKHVWSIRTRLQVEGRTRDLAMSIANSAATTHFNSSGRLAAALNTSMQSTSAALAAWRKAD